MIVANSSPLIALGRLDRLDILKILFGKIYIPNAVYQETVLETIIESQRESISKSISANDIIVCEPTKEHTFRRKLHTGEKGVLNLALEKKASGIIMDDKRARKEAKELGLQLSLLYTTDILKGAERRGLITSYVEIMEQLKTMNIFLPQ
jgi:predicted nucleic acid-binding protein